MSFFLMFICAKSSLMIAQRSFSFNLSLSLADAFLRKSHSAQGQISQLQLISPNGFSPAGVVIRQHYDIATAPSRSDSLASSLSPLATGH